MFKKVIQTPGFWRSVLVLGITFVLLFLGFKWAIEGFTFDFINLREPWLFILGSLAAGFAYGFFVTYGKFLKKIKNNNTR
jgi:TRAP-type C4-dicarboxylate transport system permease small subunit